MSLSPVLRHVRLAVLIGWGFQAIRLIGLLLGAVSVVVLAIVAAFLAILSMVRLLTSLVVFRVLGASVVILLLPVLFVMLVLRVIIIAMVKLFPVLRSTSRGFVFPLFVKVTPVIRMVACRV